MELSARFLPQTEFSSYEDFLNHCTITVPEGFNFAYDIIDEYARLAPEQCAMVWCDDKGEERRFTFAQMKQGGDRAAHLFASCGIGRGDAVLLVLKRRYEYWFCALALCKLGAVMIPATHLLTDKDITYRCNAADVKMILTVDDMELLQYTDEAAPACASLQVRAKLGGPREGWVDFDAMLADMPEDYPCPPPEERPGGKEPMLIYFTSGTTGHPKMALHDFTYPLGHIITAKYWQCVEEKGLHLTVADSGWAKCSWGKIYGQWICGACIFVYDYDKFIPAEMLRVMSDYRLNSFCAPPTIYRFLIKEDLSKYDLSSLRHAAVAGEPLNPEVFYQFRDATGVSIKEGFGQTETPVIIAAFPWLEERPGSMGRPNPLFAIELLDEQLNPCPVGEEGQISIQVAHGAPLGLFQGYYKNQALTDEAWHDGYYFTGDKAWRDEDGYLWFIGRNDDVIKSSGYRIGPFEVESALVEHPSVLECAITGVPHPVRGQVVKATIVLAAGYEASDDLVRELQEHVKHTTAPYKYPRIIEFVPELPKTISGKIIRKDIRQKDSRA